MLPFCASLSVSGHSYPKEKTVSLYHFWLVYDSSQISRRGSILLAALAEALHERLHAAADRLAAKTEQRKTVQLEI